MTMNEDTGSGVPSITEDRTDPAAFAALYRRHYDWVFRYCVHRLFDRPAAEDVTSTVFLKVVENLQLFKGNGQDFRNWLYRIATNAVNNHLRSTRRDEKVLKAAAQRQVGRGDVLQSPANDGAEKVASLKRALLALKPRYQTIVALRFFENRQLAEIAALLGSSPATVRSQLSRALASLRRGLAVEGEAPRPEA